MRAVLSVATALLGVHLCAAAATAETIERREPADVRGEVEIVNVAGDVQVAGWDRAEVQVNADLGDGVERLDFRREGRRTVVEVILPGGRTSSGASDLIVRVPRDSALSVNTVSADQTIKGVRGVQRLQAVSGTIATEVWGGEFEAKTVSGDVSVQGHGGAGLARVTTVSGDVHLNDIGRELDLNTVTGDMEVRMDELARARIKTTNGDLDLTATLYRDARIDAEAINGDLRFDLRGDLDAEFDIETFNGDIDNCFGPKPKRTHKFAPGREVRFKEGAGNAQVRIKTLNGGVEVCKS